jgi:GT2 family glycosyltransferase
VVRARFLEVGGQRLYLRGVTYGTFAEQDGVPYPDAGTVAADFAAIGASGANAIRLYTAPPRWLLDLAHDHGLKVMVGLAWEEHVAFLDNRRLARQIVEDVQQSAAGCAGHPALLCFSVGNEIPASIVRWHGSRRIERFIRQLCAAVKDVDQQALLTYVNFPSTEYLQLPFLDLVCFNVYLESPERFPSYLARLHNIAAERPLVIAELGLDSIRHGSQTQASVLARQMRAAYGSGCAGAFVFSWTDEWWRNEVEVEDWSFGLVDRHRRPKPALRAVERAFAEAPLGLRPWPRISVVVCTHNGSATIADCLDALSRLDYPDYEVIVVDDGSADGTASIAAEFDVRLISTENEGLSSARNTGLQAATGQIIAFTDDDASPDRDWLRYLAHSFATSHHMGVGGPNLEPPDSHLIERAVGRAPGGPIHVLLTDDVAEHVPGCNMAFRRDALDALGGFDPQFRIAGDDVDVCWRFQERGWTIGFSASAVVLHRRRGSVRAFLKQQTEYGKAEALLERKWPERYNRGGHLAWSGRVYGAPQRARRRRARIAYGTWGGNLFQSLYHRAPGTLGSLPLMPEWYLVIAGLSVLALVGRIHGPLVPWSEGLPIRVELILLAAAIAALVVSAARTAFTALDRPGARGGIGVLGLALILSLMQPAARLVGRLRNGLTPWRWRGEAGFVAPWPRSRQIWSGDWRSQEKWLLELERALRAGRASVVRGGDFDRWDLRVRVGQFATASVRIAVEEHGHGRQLVRLRMWPRVSRLVPVVMAVLLLWLVGAFGQDPLGTAVIGGLAAFIVVRTIREAGASAATLLVALERIEARERETEVAFRPTRLRQRQRTPEEVVVISVGGDGRWKHSGGPLMPEPVEAVDQYV